MTLSFEPIGRQISGERLVGPDGLINLGTYGSVRVAGLTVSEAKAAIGTQLSKYLEDPRVSVDVFSYNSKVYYIITEGAGSGDSLVRVPITGNETVLDALAQVNGLTGLRRKKIWIARPTPGDVQQDRILPVNWTEIVRGAATTTNYQVLPGDRIMIADDLNSTRALVSSVVHAFRGAERSRDGRERLRRGGSDRRGGELNNRRAGGVIRAVISGSSLSESRPWSWGRRERKGGLAAAWAVSPTVPTPRG